MRASKKPSAYGSAWASAVSSIAYLPKLDTIELAANSICLIGSCPIVAGADGHRNARCAPLTLGKRHIDRCHRMQPGGVKQWHRAIRIADQHANLGTAQDNAFGASRNQTPNHRLIGAPRGRHNLAQAQL